MSRVRDPFGQALDDLRRGITSGEFAPGRPIVIADEARRLRLSPTPVREALARLAGEGLVEAGPAGGYVALRLSAEILRERLWLHKLLVDAAVSLIEGEPTGAAGATRRSDEGNDAPTLFARVVQRASNAALRLAHARIDGLLALSRRAETSVLGDLEAEGDVLGRAVALEDWRAFRRASDVWHDARRGAANALVFALQANQPEKRDD